jgi:hypothetical protein
MSLMDDIRSARGYEDTLEYDESVAFPRIIKVRTHLRPMLDDPMRPRAMIERHARDLEAADDLAARIHGGR